MQELGMKRKVSEQNAGFGVAGIIIAITVVALLGFIGWRAWQAAQNKTAANDASTNKQSTGGGQSDGQTHSQSSDPYAGWKTYTSGLAGYSIKYPSDWSIRAANGNRESVFITSPDQFVVRLDSSHETSAAAAADKCGSTCLATNSLATFTVPKYGALTISADKQGAGGGSVYALDLLTATGSLSVVSPTKADVTTTATGNFQGWTEAQQTQQTLDQFTGSSSVKTAVLIYESLTY